jgi:hypothetical protein
MHMLTLPKLPEPLLECHPPRVKQSRWPSCPRTNTSHAFWNVPPGGMSIATLLLPPGAGAGGRLALGGLAPEGPVTGRPGVAEGPGVGEMSEASISRFRT